MRVKLHSDIEGGRAGDEITVSAERGRWLLERGYASSGERVDLSQQGPDYPYDELEKRGGEGNEGAAQRLKGQENRKEWTAPDPEPVQAAGNVPGIDSKEGDAQGADVTQLGAPVDPSREDVQTGDGAGEAGGGGGGAGGQGGEDSGQGGEGPAQGAGGDGEGEGQGGEEATQGGAGGDGGEDTVTADESTGRRGKKG